MRIRLRYTTQSTMKLLQNLLRNQERAQNLLHLLTQPVELHPTAPRTQEEIQSLRLRFSKEFGRLPEPLLRELTLLSPARGSGMWAGVLQSAAFHSASLVQIEIACMLSSHPMSLLVETYKLLSNYAAESATTSKPSETTVSLSSIHREELRQAFDKKCESLPSILPSGKKIGAGS